MMTMIALLKRREDLTFDEFCGWYDEHAAAATRIPYLRHYTVNIAVDGDQEWDAISMLFFSDEAEMEAALDSPEGQRSRKDTLAHVSRREALKMTQHEVTLP